MLNRTAMFMFRSLFVLGLAFSISACGYFGHDEAEEATEEVHEHMHEEMDEATSGESGETSEDAMKTHAEACPHGGGACCAHDEPHPCCEHTMKEGAEAESQPASQPSE